MDKSSLIGTLIGVFCLGFVAWHGSHGHLAMFYSQEGVFTVIGGSISVIFMALPLSRVMAVGGYMKKFMFHKGKGPIEIIQVIQALAEKARRDGILALESETRKIEDPFLAAGLKMAVDGVDPSNIEMTLRMEVLAMQDRHKSGKKFFDLVKVYGPAWGLVGTLIGQIGMFGQLEGGDIGAMGKMLALAVVATMYGTVLANAVAGPIGDKLALRSSEEILAREMMLQGILSIQAGDNPRVTLDRMMSFIPAVTRTNVKVAA
ncbi:MAG: MotA/TolQ/ExbB proton channel family protein [Phycisphaerales bacterium]|nr:MotA/TolQ/ExbB proton channel family protein [Phycisphaerales bacterium]NUQ53804.1 MotA/TolQ/ExbB proton channel family protein [Phycisphaerales bacterium]